MHPKHTFPSPAGAITIVKVFHSACIDTIMTRKDFEAEGNIQGNQTDDPITFT
jgi:hypothetical protein